jgi:hypothetical protein
MSKQSSDQGDLNNFVSKKIGLRKRASVQNFRAC